MELLEGERLRTLLVRGAPDGLPRHEAFAILRGLLGAVAYLHESGFVHRDLTPANILVTHEGVPKLLDFGLTRRPARRGEPALGVVADESAHTPAYASPQLLDGQPPDPRDDVYSLGVLAYELLAGAHPFDKLAADEAARQGKRLKAPRGLDAKQWRVLRSALSFNADDRPADARALTAGLIPPTAGGRTPRPGVAQGLLAGIAAGVLLTLVVIHPDGPIGRRVAAPEAASAPGPASTAGARSEAAAPPAGPAPRSVPAPEETERARATAAERVTPTAPAGPRTTVEGDVLTPLGGAGTAPADTAVTTPSRMPAPADAPVAAGADTPAPADRPAPARADSPAPVDAAASPPLAAANEADAPAAAGAVAPPPAPGRLELSSGVYRVSEGTAVLIVEVVRRGGTNGAVGVRWRTLPNTAGDGEDYVGSDWQRLELADGSAADRIFVPLVNDGIPERTESFYIELARPDGGATLGDRIRAEVQVTDDDPR
jgi:hypothetical protein